MSSLHSLGVFLGTPLATPPEADACHYVLWDTLANTGPTRGWLLSTLTSSAEHHWLAVGTCSSHDSEFGKSAEYQLDFTQATEKLHGERSGHSHFTCRRRRAVCLWLGARQLSRDNSRL